MRPIPLLLILSALALPALSQAAVRVEVLQNRLAQPWGMAFLPDDQGILITLRGGELKRWQPGKGLSAPIAGVPQVWANGQGGLLDVALAPDFAQSRRVWLSYAESDASGKAGTAVGYGRLSEDATQLTNFTVVFASSRSSPSAIILAAGWCSTAKDICLSGWAKIISAPPPRISASCRGKWSA